METVDTNTHVGIRPRYCGPPGLSLHGIAGTEHGGVDDGSARALETPGRRVVFTHRGRFGLGLLCRYWGLSTGDEALMPAYNCGSEVDPFVHYGLRVLFYRVDVGGRMDIDDITRRLTARTRIIYVTHYFGWPHDVTRLLALCAERNIRLVEDCALSLFSRPQVHPIGVLGDAAIYSFRKTLPVPDGGALTVVEGTRGRRGAPRRTEPAAPWEPKLRPPSPCVVARELLSLIKRGMLRMSDAAGLFSVVYRNIGVPAGVVRRRSEPTSVPGGESRDTEPMPASYYYDVRLELRGPSRFTRMVLRYVDPAWTVERRRRNYRRLLRHVRRRSLGVPLTGDLLDGVCPLVLPVVVDDAVALSRRLGARAIVAPAWWCGFHQGFSWLRYPEAQYLKTHVLALPVHQQLEEDHMDYIASVLEGCV